MPPSSSLLVCILALLSGQVYLHGQRTRNVHHATVPISVAGNAPIVTLTFRKSDGSERAARFLFDSGGGAIILDEGLAADIGLKAMGRIISDEGQQYRVVSIPAASIGGMPLDLRTSRAVVHLGAASFTDRDDVEGLLPGKALEPYQVILDYPQQKLSVGTPGSFPHQGEKIPCPYIPSSGHPRVVAEIDGTRYGFLLDTGSQITLMREDLLQRWSEEHPHWPHSAGAVGPANEGPDTDVFLLRIPALQLGPLTVSSVVAASRPNEEYSATSYETPAAIVGSVGGNVLRRFRVEIDYPNQVCYFEPSGRAPADEFDTVGLALDTNSRGQLVVRAVSSTASPVTLQNVRPGDIVLQIDDVSGAPWTQVKAAQALSGTVGERKHLRILRHGKSMSVTVVVSRIL
jgi:hypothetical protein